jgi:hypothetical protein
MKQKILIAICLLLSTIAYAQFTTTLIVNPRPPATISNWANTQGTITLIVNNLQPQGGTKRAKIKTTIKNAEGTEIALSNLNITPTVLLPDGQTVFTTSTVLPLENMQFSGKYNAALQKTGKLLSESYQLCVELVEEGTFISLSQQKCASFFVAAVQLPICMMPAKNQELDVLVAKTAITFRWTPIIPKPQGPINYRLQVFEVLESQTPMQAFRSNQPLLDQTIKERTQFIWQPQLAMQLKPLEFSDSSDRPGLPKPIQFVWSIQTLDAFGEVLNTESNYEGRSEPSVFSLVNKADKITFPPNAKAAVASCCNNSTWGPKLYGNTSSPMSTMPKCGKSISGAITFPLFLNVTYNCIVSGCASKVEYIINKTAGGGAAFTWTSGLVASGTTQPIPTLPTGNGYSLCIIGYCGGVPCSKCCYRFQY